MTIANMSLYELKLLIDEAVDRRLKEVLGEFEIGEDDLFADEEPDTRTWEEVKTSIEHNRWTPPPGSPSVNQLLREGK